jgi:hypothetical protein
MPGKPKQAVQSRDETEVRAGAQPAGGVGPTTEARTDETRGNETRAEERRRTATLDLPFVSMQFRAPKMHVPTGGDVQAAARGAWSRLPSGKSMLFIGGLAVTAAAGVIEWPVAAAIGIGSALASRGQADPTPRDRHDGDGWGTGWASTS